MDKSLSLMPAKEEWEQMKDIAKMAVASGLLPSDINTPEKAMIISLKGRELGLPPMVAYSHINVIKGKPTMSAEIMLAYIYKTYPTAEIEIEESTEKKCVISAKRPNDNKSAKFEWTIERASKMGLTGKDNWKKQPKTMLFWRTITEMKRAKFPEVLMGVDYSPEELTESIPLEREKHSSPQPVDVTPKAPKAQSIKKAEVVDESPQEPFQKKEVKNYAPTPEEIAEKKNPSSVEDLTVQHKETDREWLDLLELCKANKDLITWDGFIAHIEKNYNITDHTLLSRQQCLETRLEFLAFLESKRESN